MSFRGVDNNMIHRNYSIKRVEEVVRESNSKNPCKLNSHANHLAVNLLHNSEEGWKLKRCDALDLLQRFAISVISVVWFFMLSLCFLFIVFVVNSLL